jgi:hypothetical protein
MHGGRPARMHRARAGIPQKNLVLKDVRSGSQVGRRRKNATNRPSGLIAGCRFCPSPGTPASAPDTPIVEGVQGSRVPEQVSRRKTCDAATVTPGIMFDALETNTTYRPSALRVGIVLGPSACRPLGPSDAREVDGEHGSATPAQVSQTKMSSLRFVSSAIRLSAAETKATKRPEALILPRSLPALAWTPASSTETSAVDGRHSTVAPMQVSRRKMSALEFRLCQRGCPPAM